MDSLPLVRAWSNQGGKNKALSDVIQAIYEATLKINIALSLLYVPSGDNLADTPSRALSESDCVLSPRVWREVERCWGPHSIDLVALDSNVPRGSHGFRLRHFTPWPSTDSAVVNIFTQTLHPSDNAYVFPPFALVGLVSLVLLPLLHLILTPVVTGGLLFQADLQIRSASALWATLMYFCFLLRMAHSLPSLYVETFGRLGFVFGPPHLAPRCTV